MLIKYYRSNEKYNISYTSRNRFLHIPVEPFAQEEQRSVKFGDGASTQVKTSINNLCEYVTINNTKWFVVSYLYLNGKQIILNLQRDVIGEMGLDNCYGKIERGYTNNILKRRKELQLNQILKKRIPLIPKSNIYGNYSVDNHMNEMWGVLYLVKPSGINPETGEKYPAKVNVNIPAFAPNFVDLEYVPNGTIKTYGEQRNDVRVVFSISISDSPYAATFLRIYTIDINLGNEVPTFSVYNETSYYKPCIELIPNLGEGNYLSENTAYQIAYWVANTVYNALVNQRLAGFSFPADVPLDGVNLAYDGAVIRNGNESYSYSLSGTEVSKFGDLSSSIDTFVNNYIISQISNKSVDVSEGSNTITAIIENVVALSGNYDTIIRNSKKTRSAYLFNARKLTPTEAGDIVIDTELQLIDEPYSVLIFPLFDVTIKEVLGSKEYIIDKKNAFSVFNTVIEYLSGQNAYIVDAQIYPYCPELVGVATELQGYPFFQIMTTSYTRECEVQLLPLSDIKKEYIEREYTIISPEQTGRFTFNFYDYINTVKDVNGVNYAALTILIKTALKPFSIISSAVIQPELGSIIGMTYGSDMRGSQPSSNGFECSLSSSAFEEYKRANSNYQAIFSKQQEELKKQHEVELANEITQTVVNTTTATAMGALAGASLADTGIFNSLGTKAAGAAAGGAVAGAGVGIAMTAQTLKNESLRNYETNLQQEMFDLNIGTIKNIPNSVNRISTFNEIILKDFWYIIEVYECSEEEKQIVDNFITQYGYSIGVFDFIINYQKDGWFLRSTLVKSNYPVNLHLIAENELKGGIYYYEQG